MSEEKNVETIAYIPRIDKEGRVEFLFPEIPQDVYGKYVECFGPLMQEGTMNGPYCWTGASYVHEIERTEPFKKDEIDEESDLFQGFKEKLEQIEHDFRLGLQHVEEIDDIELKYYQKRTQKHQEAFQKAVASLDLTGDQ
jgi:hypothetical protein